MSPPKKLITGTESDLNNNSVVIWLVYKKTSLLLTGDAAFEAENEIIKKGFNIKSTVLKIGHHGSSTSTSEKFLKYVKPKIAIISAGKKNRYHHPHPSLLKRLQDRDCKVYRTDISGTITIKSDGQLLSIKSSK
ncbi:MAG: MBL fold metallo-hydrolase [bacterium]